MCCVFMVIYDQKLHELVVLGHFDNDKLAHGLQIGVAFLPFEIELKVSQVCADLL